ncbi:MAG: hypothetical protein Q7U04_09050 [Bacteriovorax sp.]|nr:hypothetical protein [Bacteriovorax sp.]
MKFIILILFFVLINSSKSFAIACATNGAQRYSANSMQICLANVWENAGTGVIVSGCTVGESGKQKYLTKVMQFCNGTNWIKLDACPPTVTACTVGGNQQYTLGTMSYCDGSFWVQMAGTCPTGAATSNCSTYTDSSTCNSSIGPNGNCQWDVGFSSCGDPMVAI